MVISPEPAVEPEAFFEEQFEEAIVYADMDAETVLHEGPLTVLANGWVKLPSGRLLSPDAVHHIDPA